MIYRISMTNQFKRDFSYIIKRNLDINKFKKILEILQTGSFIKEDLNSKTNINHCGELHIEPDWLLVYKYDVENKILYLIRTGSHCDLY